jgi:serine phosphatase RsbU (regulator of sigma subunit)
MYDYPRFKEKFGEILKAKSPKEIVDAILEAVDSWRGNAEQEDDISLMVIKVK